MWTKRQRQKDGEMKMINDRQAKGPKESQKETGCVRQRKQGWRKAMRTESSLYSSYLPFYPALGDALKVFHFGFSEAHRMTWPQTS